MMTELRWICSPRPTVFHAAGGLDAGLPTTMAELTQAMSPPLVEINHRLIARNMDRPTFWRHLVALSRTNDSMTQITSTVCRKMLGSAAMEGATIKELFELLADLAAAAGPHAPDQQELTTRMGPLQMQWATYGPGILLEIQRLTDTDVLTDRADCIVVAPVFGGAAAAHLQYNTVHIEGVLTNVLETLPEVLRLAWAVCQLNNDLPRYSETINRHRLSATSGLAMIAPTLLAGEAMGIAHCDRDAIASAIEAWHVFRGDSALAAEIVDDWWTAARTSDFGWGTALQALDRMMQPLYLAQR